MKRLLLGLCRVGFDSEEAQKWSYYYKNDFSRATGPCQMPIYTTHTGINKLRCNDASRRWCWWWWWSVVFDSALSLPSPSHHFYIFCSLSSPNNHSSSRVRIDVFKSTDFQESDPKIWDIEVCNPWNVTCCVTRGE
jgi:hypothetical protein